MEQPKQAYSTHTSYKDILTLVEDNKLDEATAAFDTFDYGTLSTDEALQARAIALQLAIVIERYFAALRHADAALDLADDEPLLYYLAGQALIATGSERAGADAVVFAAELLQEKERTMGAMRFEVNAAGVYALAAEICSAYALEQEAMTFALQAAQVA